jgi:hypothetical protein
MLPDDIKIEKYIAQNDFDYPLPNTGDLNVISGAGIKDNNAYILMGLSWKF